VTVVVTDNGTPVLSDSKSFTVVVVEVNTAPVLAAIADQTIAEGATLIATNSATDIDLPANVLVFSLTNAPSGMTIDATNGLITWTPTEAQGPSTNLVTVVVTDSGTPALSDSKTFTVVMTAINDAPFITAPAAVSVAEDTVLSFSGTNTIQVSDVDAGDGLLRLSLSVSNGVLWVSATNGIEWLSGTNGSASMTMAGTLANLNTALTNLTYLSATNYCGPDTLTLTLDDQGNSGSGGALTASALIAINVLPINDPPIALAQSLVMDEDTSLPIILSGSDADGDTLTFTVVSGPTNGVLSGVAPSLIYLPNTNYNGPDAFSFTVSDGSAISVISVVSITVNPVNDAPVPVAQNLTTPEDTSLPIILSGSDVDGDALTFTVVSGPANGVLSGTAPNVIYTPVANFNGSDVFTFVANDGQTNSAPTMVSLIVAAVNDPPRLTVPGDQTMAQGAALVFDTNRIISGADVDAGTGMLQLSLSVSNGVLNLGATNGLVWVSGTNGANSQVVRATLPDLNAALYGLTYLIAPGFSGTDTLVLAVSDEGWTGSGGALSDTQAIAIAVESVGRQLLVEAGTNQTILWTNQTVILNGEVRGAGLPSGEIITCEWSQVSGPGMATFSPSTIVGTLPNNGQPMACRTLATLDAPGNYVLRLTASDSGESNMDNVTLTFNVPDTALLALDQTVVTSEDNWVCFKLMGYDLQGSNLTFTMVQSCSHGSCEFVWIWDWTTYSYQNVTTSNSIQVWYQPEADYHGPDHLTFKASNGSVESAEATVSILVTPVNDPPVANNVALNATAATPVHFVLQGSDVDGDSLLFRVVTPPLHGTVAFDPGSASTNAVLAVYNPEANYSGPDQFEFCANDGQVDSPLALASISVLPDTVPGDMVVEAGPDQQLTGPGNLQLSGLVQIPNPVTGAQTNATWSRVYGPGQVVFSDAHALTTSASVTVPGTYILMLSVEYAGYLKRDTLTVDVLAGEQSPRPEVRSNQGTDFWLAILANSQAWSEPLKAGVSVVITAQVDTTGRLTYGDFQQSFTVRAGVPTVVDVISYWGTPDYYSDSVSPDAIHVTAADPVTVFELNYIDASTDGYTALPSSLLGQEYVVLGYGNELLPWLEDEPGIPFLAGGSQFAVVGVQSNTAVTITPASSSGTRVAGVPYTIILQTGETYRMIDWDTVGGDFSGTIVVSDKPVAVFGGHKSAAIPHGQFGYSDHLEEQLPPVNLWGRHFLTTPLATRQNGDTFRIAAAHNATVVWVNGVVLTNLNRGQWHEFILTNSAEIISSQPILVAQYANSTDYDGVTGDPFMMVIPAVEQYGRSYVFGTTSEFDYFNGTNADFFDNYVNVIVPNSTVGSVMLDGQAVAANAFVPIANSGYSGAQIHVESGAHILEGPAPFGACIYGWAFCESYAFMGGLYARDLVPGSRLELAQTTPYAAVGMEKAVVAKVLDAGGQPLADVQVQFTVSGANSASGWAATVPSGEVTFAYSGQNLGTDVIQAKCGALEQSLTNTWIAATSNQPPAISVKPIHSIRAGNWYEIQAGVTDDGQPADSAVTTHWRLMSGPVPVPFLTNAPASLFARFEIPGIYVFELTASDSQFSSRALVTVGVNALPEISMERDPVIELYPVGGNIVFTVHAFDPGGCVRTVELFEGERRLGLLTAPNGEYQGYYFNWTPLTNGPFSLTAVATDDWGESSRTSVSLWAGYAPTAILLSPTNGQIFKTGESMLLQATASDPDGSVQYVDYAFYSEALWSYWIFWFGLGSAYPPNFSYDWTPASYYGKTLLLSVAAVDDQWLYGQLSPPIVVFISNSDPQGNAAPVISMSYPTGTLVLPGPTNILLTATASDPDGSISKVEFYDGAARLEGLVTSLDFHGKELT
jgi:hypothetical protein